MKKYLLTFAVALMAAFAFTACSSSDDDDPTPGPTPDPTPDSPYAHQPFTVTAVEAGAEVDFKVVSSGMFPDYFESDVKLVYSTDKIKWEDYALGTKLTLAKAGDNVYFKAGTKSNPNVQTSSFNKVKPGDSFRSSNVTFEASKRINVSGNILSLLYGEKAQRTLKGDADHEFSSLFSNCKTLVDASNLILPTNVSAFTFYSTFSGCSSLASAPQLPATQLAKNCYGYMFGKCTSLTKAPNLPATTLESSCYGDMFKGCTALIEAPKLPATKMASYCYISMFEGCSSLKEAPELPAKEVAEYCCFNMFFGCSALVKAPKILPSTKMEKLCYGDMFEQCTSLTEAPELPAKELAEECYTSMFKDCSALKEAPKLPATTLAKGCYSYMFIRCNSLKKTPELPATTLAEGCYKTMFDGCENLETAATLAATDATVNEAYLAMFNACPKLNHVEMLATKVSDSCLKWFISNSGTTATTPPVLYVAKGMKSNPIIAAMEGLTWTVKEK